MTTEEGAAATSPTAAPGDVTMDRLDGPFSAIGRFARWRASWRVAIRIARRDARRYKWRSALIVAMVGLPVLFLTSGITLMATNDVSTAESVPRVMGSAQALIHDGGIGHLAQSPNGQSNSNGTEGDREAISALAVPGFAAGSAWTTGKVEKLTGGRVIRSMDARVRVTLGDRHPSVPVLGIDARDPLARGMTELASGRWARTPSEIVVTEAGVAKGLPAQGRLTADGSDGKPRQLTVVGVAVAQSDRDLPFMVASPDLLSEIAQRGEVELGFLVGRPDPVTWSDVRTLNTYGLLVQSRQVLLYPPPVAQVDPKVAQTMGSNQNRLDLVILIAAVGLFIETTLLAGPAFAVSAARQRRSLALAAANGAEARQLRRYVLGQALVLGVVSAAIAVAAGVLLTRLGIIWWKAGHADFVTGPFEVSWPRVAGVFLCSLLASLLAALLPARGLARLDIVSVLAGRTGDRAVHRGLPVVGLVVMALSGGVIFWGASADAGSIEMGSYAVAVGAVCLVVGCLMLIPALLALVGRLGTRLVLPLRLAARDTARQRARSTPAVAAIMAAVAALTALSVGAASDTRQSEIEYRAQLPMGHGRIWIPPEQDQASVRSVITAQAPELVVTSVSIVGQAQPMGQGTAAEQPASGSRLDVVAAKPSGCSDAAVFGAFGAGGGPVDPSCARLGDGAQAQNTQIMVVSPENLAATTGVSDAERRTLQTGGILVFDPALIDGGFVDFVAGGIKNFVMGSPAPNEMPVVTSHQRLPASAIDRKAWQSALTDKQVGAWVLPATAAKLGWPVTLSHLQVTSPTGMISGAAESAINDRLGEDSPMMVERGFQNEAWLILLILFSVAGALVLIASLISTALSLAESQNDMATLAAVGATRHTRRGIAASQALVVALCGCLLGLLVGLVPGIAITWPLTTQGLNPVTGQPFIQPPIIIIPWLHLVAICAGVPLLAAGLAWVSVRRHPQMTRRLV
ncbi:MAG TPA: FtsX-like permease family protein [Dermatophilaceae bacterium]|nr:FtsX-like permease family protein [Dermatophilaceae bacterium]